MNPTSRALRPQHLRRWRGAFICLAAAALLSTASAQTKSLKTSPPLKESSPARAGISTELLSRIDALLDGAVKEGRIPGVVALVARHGKIVYYKSFGAADPDTHR